MKEALTKTVYSLIYPETEDLLKTLWEKQPISMYHKAYEGGQDQAHLSFFKTYKNWIKGNVVLPENFHEYPTNGSSEAIRESLAAYASQYPQGNIHVFEGEYEGYEALGAGYGLKTIKHKQENFQTLKKILPHEPFYLSQPSSINGCYWSDFSNFIKYIEDETSCEKVRLDLCYIGTTTKEELVQADSHVIDMIFFSLSKVFGVYYHRIGGVFSRKELPGLYGNQWFKNLFSLHFGEELLKKYSRGELPKKYAYLQEEIKNCLNKDYSLDLESSDVILLLKNKNKSMPEFQRNDQWARICITALIDRKIKP